MGDDLPWCYPMLPKFFHIYPQVGEVVRIFIEDIKYPRTSRFWLGNIVSQLQKIEYDNIYTALSTTNIGMLKPEKSISSYPDAEGVFPIKSDIAIIGKVNTDVILRLNEVHIRAGKHENGNPLKLNTKNPADISLVYESMGSESSDFYSSTVIESDKIAIISHTGNPQFKPARVTAEDRKRIFDEGHPLGRGDLIVQAFEVVRKALIAHIHGYSGLPTDKTAIINDLEKLNFDAILQKNIVIN
jgi:hypothetical protein